MRNKLTQVKGAIFEYVLGLGIEVEDTLVIVCSKDDVVNIYGLQKISHKFWIQGGLRLNMVLDGGVQ